ncbi:MAG: hypothetical protein IT461_12245 [Planctomycetes bacterium]|jgi:hypothetical protein|nr:hypothetical protein [Planctomycetota bacterium]
MSNAHYRNTQAAPQVKAPQARQQMIEQLEAGARRRKMIDDAIYRLYLKRDGDRIEALLKVFDMGIAIATICRAEELKRAQEKGITLREKGERPVCSNSETRLFSTRQLQLMDRRNEIKASCRAEVMDWIAKWGPQDDAALRVALDTCLGEISEETRHAVETSEGPLGVRLNRPPTLEEIDRMPLPEEEREFLRKAETLKQQLKPEDYKALNDAQARGDTEAADQVLARQPIEWMREFAEATMKLMEKRKGK